MSIVNEFLTRTYTDHAGFAFTVSRDLVGLVKTPLLIAPDNIPVHPYGVAMEVANLSPNSEVTIFPWKDSLEHIGDVTKHARRFLKQHEFAKR